MPTKELLLFDRPGPKHTEATLEAAKARAHELGISTIVVATSTGDTALKLLKVLDGTPMRIVAVTLHAGCWEKYCPPDPQKVKSAEDLGVRFLTATHALMGHVGSAVRDKFGGIGPTEVVAYTYYTFGQGMKVAVEVALMAADAGLLGDEKEVIAIAGTGEGADTAIVVSPAFTTNVFDLRVREIIAMARGN